MPKKKRKRIQPVVTRSQVENYLKHGGSRCLFCGSTNTEAGSHNADDDWVEYDIKCLDCGKEWQDIHDLCGVSRVTIVPDKAKIYLGVYDMTIVHDGKGGMKLAHSLYDGADSAPDRMKLESAIFGVETFILAMARAGVDLKSDEFVTAMEETVAEFGKAFH